MPTSDLSVKYATWIDKARPTTSFFGRTGYVAAAADRMVGLLVFSNPFPPHTTQNVEKGVLRLVTRAAKGTVTLSVAQLANNFTPSAATWNRVKQQAGFKVSLTKTNPGEGTVWEFDVTPGMKGVGAGSPLYGFIVTSSTADPVLVQGNMTPAVNPRLQVTYSQAPLPPTNLEPSAGRRVGDSSPTLLFTNTDIAGNRNLAAAQVQMSTSATFDKLLWDSGTVTTTTPEIDLGAVQGAPTLSTGTTYWWRVRTQDGAGLWSDYSAPVSFTYTPRPVLTLRNPDAGTPVVYDPTPPIDWTYSSPAGSNQTRWRVVIYQPAGATYRIITDSGVQMGTDTEWTPTKGLPGSGAYRVVVDAWDGYTDRQATPGAATYASVVQNFTYTHEASVAAVTNLAAVKPDARMPAVRLSWRRSDQPDGWVIYRDGKLMARYDGDVIATGPDTYTWQDLKPPAGVHTWSVHAIVNGKTSAPANLVFTNRFLGTWLYRDDNSNAGVCIVNDRDHALTLPETSQQVDVLGSPLPITITTAMQGYQGKVEGNLVPIFGMPTGQNVAAWHDRMLQFKVDVGQQYRLVGVGELDLPVLIRNVNVAPVPASGDPVWSVSFDYSQCDEYPADFDSEG